MQKISYRIEKANNPYYVMSFQMHWRKMPYILDRLCDLNIDIRKAHLRNTGSTLYMKRNDGKEILSKEVHELINEAVFDGYHDQFAREKVNRIVLPVNTDIQLYNVPNLSKTTLEFSCQDRLGLLADMLDLLVQFPYELRNGYISTVGPYAHNIFFLQKNKKQLTMEDIQYISNVFEYEVKNREVFLQNSSPSQ